MNRHTLTTVLLTLTIALPAFAAEPIAQADELAWSITLHPKALAQSDLGRSWTEQVGQLHPDWNEKNRMVSESLGIDLWKTSDTIVLFNDSYEPGAFVGVAMLGPSAGNIEGALLSVPGYESQMYDDDIIMNIIPWEHRRRDDDKLFSAVVRLEDGRANYFVAGLDRGAVEDLIERLREGRTDLNLSASDATALMSMHAYRSAPKRTLRGPYAGLIGMLTGMELRVSEDGGQMTASLIAEVDEPARARQLQQMAQGWTTFLTMAAGFNESAAPTHAVMEQIEVLQDERKVSLSLTCGSEAVIDAIRNLAVDKPFDSHEHHGDHE